MELMQSKIPFLPPDWTVVRGAKYVTRLTVFILFPGLHQISSGRKVFGGLLFALYFFANFYVQFHPWNDTESYTIWHLTANELINVARYVTWGMLVIDFRGIERRLLSTSHLLLITSFALLMTIADFHNHGPLNLYVEKVGNVCPTYCRYDIVEFDWALGPKQNLAIGKYFVMHDHKLRLHVAKVLANSPERDCAKNGPVFQYLPAYNKYCRHVGSGYDYMKYLVQSSWHPMDDALIDKDISAINEVGIHGINPRKIGNLRQYYFLNDTMTDFIGNTLITIYEWTGINFFK
jgi:hypothetical protein